MIIRRSIMQVNLMAIVVTLLAIFLVLFIIAGLHSHWFMT